jgi:hypothetical protein
MNLLQNYSRPRQWAIKVCANGNFELVAILLIFVNCVTLAMFNPLGSLEEGLNAKLDQIGEWLDVLRQLGGWVVSRVSHPGSDFD